MSDIMCELAPLTYSPEVCSWYRIPFGQKIGSDPGDFQSSDNMQHEG